MRTAKNKTLYVIAAVFVILFVLVVIISTFLNQKNIQTNLTQENRNQSSEFGKNYNSLTTCVDNQPIFDVLPVSIDALRSITPLGNINVPDHAIPTDHVYLVLKRSAEDLSGKPVPAQLVSPGSIVVTGISRTSETKNGVQISNDYGLEFYGCKGVSYYFAHIQKIDNSKLKAEFNNLKDSDCTKGSPADNTFVENCTKKVDIKLESAEIIGVVGSDNNPGVDLGAFNETKKLNFINKTIYPPKTANGVCPFDLFSSLTQQQAYSLLTRTLKPFCGKIMQDVVDTIQGNWFYGDTTQYNTYADWNNHLSIVHDNLDPKIGVIAIAGVITSPKIIMYSPTRSGNINREPSSILPSEDIYCYQSDSALAGNKYIQGSLLVQLKDNKTLKLEWRDVDCSLDLRFSNPKEYSR